MNYVKNFKTWGLLFCSLKRKLLDRLDLLLYGKAEIGDWNPSLMSETNSVSYRIGWLFSIRLHCEDKKWLQLHFHFHSQLLPLRNNHSHYLLALSRPIRQVFQSCSIYQVSVLNELVLTRPTAHLFWPYHQRLWTTAQSWLRWHFRQRLELWYLSWGFPNSDLYFANAPSRMACCSFLCFVPIPVAVEAAAGRPT